MQDMVQNSERILKDTNIVLKIFSEWVGNTILPNIHQSLAQLFLGKAFSSIAFQVERDILIYFFKKF